VIFCEVNPRSLQIQRDNKDGEEIVVSSASIALSPITITFALKAAAHSVIYLFSLIASCSISTEGTFMSFPDSSMNILHENPTVPVGCNSFPSINTEGEPESPRDNASASLIL